MSDRIAEIKARADAIYSTVEFVTIVAATVIVIGGLLLFCGGVLLVIGLVIGALP